MSGSPTTRSLALVRQSGGIAAVVEKWNPHARIRQDLFGIIDIVAVCGGVTTGIQATSSGNVASRVKKLNASDALPWLRQAGWKIVVHGWSKNSKGRWQYREVQIL
jgi:hypothetical protein